MKNANLPHHLYVNVKNSFLGNDMPIGHTPAIWHAVYSRIGQLICCHVVLQSGAHWSGLPLSALSTTEVFDDGKNNAIWAYRGFLDAEKYVFECRKNSPMRKGDFMEINLINDYDWLENKFNACAEDWQKL